MPLLKSAKKALRTSEKKRVRNEKQKAELKAAIKNTTAKNLSETISKIDKAVKSNLIHRNKAARMKSKLTKKIAGGKELKSAKKETTKKTTKKATKKTAKKATKKTAKKTTKK